MSDTLKILDTNFTFIPTDKGLNYIVCKEFKEVFFDIFEINCGGNKIIAEKVDDLSGDPVLKLTTEYNNTLYNSLYVLKEGDDNIIFNVNSLDNGRRVFTKEKQILESVVEEENLSDPELIVEDTYITSESASIDIERYKADAIRVINENHSNKKLKIEQLSESLTNLIDERLSELKSSSITDIKSLKSDILKSFDERLSQVEIISDRAVAEANSIRDSIEATAELYTNIVTTNADEKTKQLQDLREGVVYDVNTKIAELQTELVNQEAQVNNAFQSIQTFIDESKKQLLEQKTTNITDVEHICNESKQIISENLKRAESLVSNKIGKLQSTADKKIHDITTLVENRISVFDNKIVDINSAIERAENSLKDQISQGLNNILTEAKSHSSILEDKKIEIEELVSKTANELSVLGSGIVEAVEKKVKDFNLVAIKREDLNSLKKQLETRLENESANLKKYVAGYGGGGSVAVQYANGGTMNGSLNIASGQILSGGIDIGTIFGGGTGVSYLSALNDVSIPSPANGQVLVYSSVLQKWTTGSPASASGQTGYYGSFYDTTAQTLTSTTQAKRINIADTFEANGISLSSNKIVFNNIGTYELIFSIQYKNTSNAQEDIYVWFRKNGVDVPDSSSVFTIPARKNASIPAQLIAVTPFIATLAANDFIELYWHCNNTAVTVETFTTHTNPTIPDTPGVIVTVKQVTNVQLVPTVGAYLPLSGGTLTGAVSTTNVLYTTGGNSNQWNNTYSTVQTNSGSWNPAGSYLPLSGGTMTGNITRDNGSEAYILSQSNLIIYNYTGGGSTEMTLTPSSLVFSDSNEGGGSISIATPTFNNQYHSVTLPSANGNIMTDESVWGNTLPIGWYDAMFYRDGAANTIAQRNGASAQTFRVYNKFTSASIYERGFNRWNSNVFQVGTEKLGTGMSARALGFVTDGTERLNIGTTGAITTTNSVSTTNVMYASGGNSNQWNSSYTTVQSNSATWGGGGGEGLTIFSEVSSITSPNNTVPTFGLSARSLSANVDFAIIPKGTGAFILGPVPDSTGTGGNKRGQYAVDLQISKSATAARVASGNYSFLAGLGGSSTADATTSIGQGNLVTSNYAVGLGYGNTASGLAAISLGYGNANSGTVSVALGQGHTTSNNRSYAIGYSNTASGDASGAMGDTCTASAKSALATGLQSQASRYAQKSHAAGQFAAVGDAQAVQFVVRNKTTNNTATTLFLDGSSTRLTIPSGRIFSGTVNIVGSKSDGTAVVRYLRQVTIKNVAGTTSLVGDVVTIGSDEAAATSISITADDTNDALSIQVTGITAETWRWVATIDGAELAYGV